MTARKRERTKPARTSINKQPLHPILTRDVYEWLCHLQLDNPAAKSVLLALVLHADAEGVCFPSIGRLAQITDLDPSTVRRRLGYLQEIGVISRLPQYIDENGVRNGQRGRQTSDKIRLSIPIEIHTREDSNNSPAVSADLTERTTDAGLALAQPSHSGEGLIYEQELEQSPLPPSGGSQDDLSCRQFIDAWGEPITKPSLVEAVWATLTPAERAMALKSSTGYRAWYRSQRKPPAAISARTFLRERGGWAQWLSYAPQISKSEQLVAELAGSAAWRARCTIAKIAGTPPPAAIELPEGRGNRLPPLPPKYVALEQYADDDSGAWEFFDEMDLHCCAWCDFLHIEPRAIKVGTKIYEHNGRTYPDWPVKRHGLRVPCPWPPGYDAEVVL